MAFPGDADAGGPADGEVGTAATRRRRRRRVTRTVTFSGYADRWVTARMQDRDQQRNGVIEDLILGEIDRGGRRLTPSELNDLAGHANTIGLVLASPKLRARHPDDVRAFADASAALAQIRRLLHGASTIP